MLEPLDPAVREELVQFLAELLLAELQADQEHMEPNHDPPTDAAPAV